MSTDSSEQESSQKFSSQPARLYYGAEPQQFGELYLPETAGPHPVVILIHGGFWRAPYGLALMTGLAEDLVGRGLAVWNMEYRRIGDSGGGWPGTLFDVAQAADHLRTLALSYPLDLQRVIAIGHSAGGHLALWLAARPRLAANSLLTMPAAPLTITGAISQAGTVDLEHVWQLHLGNDAAAALLGGSPDVVRERYEAASPAAHLPLGLPQILIHGTQDDRVPLSVSEQYLHKATEAGDAVTLITLPGADHFVVIDPKSEAWRLTVKQIDQLLS